METGTIVLSKAGRDADRLFLVLGRESEGFVLIADGKLRLLEKPKRKKEKHLIRKGFDGDLAKLAQEHRLTDRLLRQKLELMAQ